MNTHIKICGLSTEASVDAAAKAGATHIGLNLYEKSPRYVPMEKAAALRMRAPASLKVVLLLVNAEPGLTAKAIEVVKPDIVQFHGSETATWLRVLKSAVDIEIWKAFGVRDAASLKNADEYVDAADLILFDAPAQVLPGGTGMRFDWSLLTEHNARNWSIHRRASNPRRASRMWTRLRPSAKRCAITVISGLILHSPRPFRGGAAKLGISDA